MRGAGAGGAEFGVCAVGAHMAIVLALVAANGLFNILVWGGEVTTDEDPVDQEGVGGFGGGEGDFKVGVFLSRAVEEGEFCPGGRVNGVG